MAGKRGIIQFEVRLSFEKVPFQTIDRYTGELKLKIYKHVGDIVEKEGNPKQNKTSQGMNEPYCYLANITPIPDFKDLD